MERHAFAMKVKEGKMNDYRKILGEIWPELTAYPVSYTHLTLPTIA